MLKPKIKGQRRKLYHHKDIAKDFRIYQADYIILYDDGIRYTGTVYYVKDNINFDHEYNEYDNTKVIKGDYFKGPGADKTGLFVAD